MPNYCVRTVAQPGSGDHEVHDLASQYGCLPHPSNQRNLGWHADCASAVRAARSIYSDVNGCFYCANRCHTT